jgi:hypothetical protein
MNARPRRMVAALLIAVFVPASRSIPAEQTALSTFGQPSLSHQTWGHTPDGSQVEIYSLRNAKGMEAYH